MDWVDGTDLADLRTAHGRPGLPPSLVLQWLAQAAAALSHLHALDPPVFHADVKPANLLLTQGGSIVLVDFGLAASGLGGLRGGTSGYMAPELQAGGDPSRASDIYALAATAWSLLAGAPPPDEPGPWPAGPVVRQAIEAGLDPDPANRPRSVGELVERMRAGWGATLPTGVLTFLATTVHGAAERWAADPTAMARDVAAADQHVARLVEEHGGRFLAARDGEKTLSVFGGAVPAVATAVAIQRAHPEGDRLPMGIALHTGEAEVGGDDYVGAALGTTSWLRGCARPGEVLVSDATAALVAVPDAPWRLVDLGPHLLRRPPPARPRGRRGGDQRAARRPGAAVSRPPALLRPRPRALPRARGHRRRAPAPPGTGAAARAGRQLGQRQVLRAAGGDRARAAWRGGGHAGPAAGAAACPARTAGRPVRGALHARHRPRPAGSIVDALLRHPDVLVLAMRADFYGRCSEHPALAAAVARQPRAPGPDGRGAAAQGDRRPRRDAGRVGRAGPGRRADQGGQRRARRAAAALARAARDLGAAHGPHAHGGGLRADRRRPRRHRRHRGQAPGDAGGRGRRPRAQCAPALGEPGRRRRRHAPAGRPRGAAPRRGVRAASRRRGGAHGRRPAC